MADDKSTGEMNQKDQQELLRLRIAKEKLDLEYLTMTVETEKARRAQIARNFKVQQETLDQIQRDIIRDQDNCKHKKGGKNLEGILNGNDSDYSVIKHMYPWGVVGVICTRCSREWLPPNPRLKRADKEAFLKLEKEYKEAVNWPTDNEPSGTQLFHIQRVRPETVEARA